MPAAETLSKFLKGTEAAIKLNTHRPLLRRNSWRRRNKVTF
jgi:hypothetical protein